MPRLIVMTNLLALLALSVLLGAGLTAPAGGGSPVEGTAGVLVLSVAVAAVVIMTVTEWFTGIRWVPLVALTALVVVSLVGWSSTTAHAVSVTAVCAAWAALAYWFAVLSFRSRENR